MTNQPIPVVTEAGDYNFYAENLAQCIKSTHQFSGVLHKNICDGTSPDLLKLAEEHGETAIYKMVQDKE